MSKAMIRPKEVFPGVVWWYTETEAIWRGTAQALTDAGLAKAYQFPGMPGNGRTSASFNPDGTKPQPGRRIRMRTSGSITIKTLNRATGTLYEVRMLLPTRMKPSAAAPAAVLPPPDTEQAIENVLQDLGKLDASICGMARVPSPAPRLSAHSLARIRAIRHTLQSAIAEAEWEVA